MEEYLEKVEEFHKSFNVGETPQNFQLISADDYELRHNLMNEENQEYLEACRNNDLIEIADALGDQLYILCGTILKHGLQDKIESVFNEIQGSNMSKLGEDGKPILREDGKILKGSNYYKPNISSALKETQYYATLMGQQISKKLSTLQEAEDFIKFYKKLDLNDYNIERTL